MRLKNFQPKGVQADRPCPVGFCPKPFLALIYGSKGSGKTNLLINMIKEYDRFKFFQKVIVFSPTFHNDPKYDEIKKGSYELQIYPQYTNEIFKEVVDEIRKDLDEWEEYKRLYALWQKSKKVKSIDQFTDDELLDLHMIDFEPPPKTRFDKEPYTFILFDDQVGNRDLFGSTKNFFAQFAILHRHLRCACAFGIQIYRNGMPKQLRNNVDWWVLSSSKSLETMESVASELDSYASKDDIAKMWELATEQPYSFFCINLMVPKQYRFTRNFDEPIVKNLADQK